jgi:hypothetical protein
MILSQLSVNSQGVSLDGSASCKSSGEVGAFHRASVVFKNVSEEAMCDMVCTVSAKAEGQDIGDGIVAVGATESMWSDVPPGGQVTHEVRKIHHSLFCAWLISPVDRLFVGFSEP